MILIVDCGNTTVVSAIVNKERVIYQNRIDTVLAGNTEHITGLINSVLEKSEEEIEGSVFVSVVPSINEVVVSTMKQLTSTDPLIINKDLNLGFTMKNSHPEKTGCDRLVDMAYAVSQVATPLVTIDMGTATTFSVINKDKEFVGGVICAGLMTSLNALSSKAAQLPEIEIDDQLMVIGDETVDQMESGAVFGAAAMIDGIIERIEEQLGEKVNVVLTGGLSKMVAGHCNKGMHYEPELLIKGLYTLWTLNK